MLGRSMAAQSNFTSLPFEVEACEIVSVLHMRSLLCTCTVHWNCTAIWWMHRAICHALTRAGLADRYASVPTLTLRYSRISVKAAARPKVLNDFVKMLS
jgi:hypothetical protein